MTTPSAGELAVAAEYLETQHRREQAIATTAKVLRDLSALQARFDEVRGALPAAQAAVEETVKQLTEARQALGEATTERGKILADAAAEAAGLISSARAEAEQLDMKAGQAAEKLYAEAKARADVEDQHAAAARAEVAEAAAALKEKRAEHEKLLAAWSAEAKALEERVARAKEAAARIAAGG